MLLSLRKGSVHFFMVVVYGRPGSKRDWSAVAATFRARQASLTRQEESSEVLHRLRLEAVTSTEVDEGRALTWLIRKI